MSDEITTPCEFWQGGCTTGGYPESWDGEHVYYVHRRRYEAAHGPLGKLTIHHRCHQRACINVEHMIALRRDEHAGAAGHGKLTREDARDIRRRVAGGETHTAVARSLGVSRSLVSMIVSGRRWAAA